MKTQLIILEQGNIIVSDEEINGGDWYYRIESPSAIVTKASKVESELLNRKTTITDAIKLIASDNPEHKLPKIDYNGLEDKLDIIDIEILIPDYAPHFRELWKDGFKKAQSLNGKMFSLEDMKKAYYSGRGLGKLMETHDWDCFEKSLQKPKVFDIEVEMECVYGDNCPSKGAYNKQHLCKVQPKITDNSIKIINVY